MCTLMACADLRDAHLNVVRVRDAVPHTDDDLPLPTFMIKDWTDEEMRHRWYCSIYTWDGESDQCGMSFDSPPIADAVN